MEGLIMIDTIKVNVSTILDKCSNIEENDDGVKVISICQFAEAIWPDFFSNFKRYHIRDEALTKLIEKYTGKLFNYYGKPKEDFFIREAIEETFQKGLKIVIVEDMS
jgi:hypothetical protein